MKKVNAVVATVFLGSTVFAGGVDNKTNLNAGYERNPSRNTECTRPEAVFYNVGGVSFMENGLYAEAGDQFVFKTYSNELDNPALKSFGLNKNYEDKRNVFLYPNAELVYKRDNWAVFFGFGVFGGGGNLEYSDGTGATALAFLGKANEAKSKAEQYAVASDTENATKYAGIATAMGGIAANHSLDVYSVQLGEIVGLSAQLTDWLSVGVATRFMHGTQSITLKSAGLKSLGNSSDEIGYEANGFSVGGMFGVHAKPMRNMDISVQYQSITRLNYKYSDWTGSDSITKQVITNKKDDFRNDLPAALNVGFGYQIIEPLYVSASFNYYFNKFSVIESPLDGSEYDYDDSWELACGADYRLNDMICFGAGLAYTNNGTKDDVNNVFSPVLNSVVFGAGIEVTPIKMLTLTASGLYGKYFAQDYTVGGFNLELNKKIFMAAFGATLKLDI